VLTTKASVSGPESFPASTGAGGGSHPNDAALPSKSAALIHAARAPSERLVFAFVLRLLSVFPAGEISEHFVLDISSLQ
jgi:hypothetical protein